MARERAKQFLKVIGDRIARHGDAWQAHQNSYFDIAQAAVESEEYAPGKLLADAVHLTLECYGLTLECVAPNEPVGTVTVRGVGTEIELDQQSEMGGPVRFPALDGTSGAPLLIHATGTSGGVPIANAYARILPNGEAWASLVDLIDITPGLPDGNHSMLIGGATLPFTRVTLAEGKVLFGSGTIPATLAADPALGLDDLAGPPTFL